MPGSARAPLVAVGRRVSLLPRAGGAPCEGTLASLDTARAEAVMQVRAEPAEVSRLDRSHVWLSTVGDAECGVTIFEGRALAAAPDLLEVTGAVVLVDYRRSAVRAPGGIVTVPPVGAPERTFDALDLSRSGVRLQLDGGSWDYADPIDVVVDVGAAEPVLVLGQVVRRDSAAGHVVLRFVDVAAREAEVLDRFALAGLAGPG